MAVTSIFGVDQDAAIVQAEALISEVNASGYEQVREIIVTHTPFRFGPWTVAMQAAVDDAFSTIASQAAADGDYNRSNATVRRLVGEGNKWRKEGHEALVLQVAMDVPGAADVAEQVAGIGATVDSYVTQRTDLQIYIVKLSRIDHKAVDLSDAWMEKGRSLVRSMSAQRSGADAAKGVREVETSDLAKALVQIAKLAEQYAAARALASTRSGQELPGFDLTYIRAAAAPKAAPKKADGDEGGDKGL
jgi:hypothetical protein